MRRLSLAALALLGAARAHAQTTVRDAGPGMSGRLLRAVLAAPHVEIRADTGLVTLRRDTSYSTTVVVIGGSATVASHVSGDVFVVGGDLFLHPGGAIAGRAVAIGGGVMNSTLATVGGVRLSFRDNTFVLVPGAATPQLAYREIVPIPPYRALTLPGAYGFRIPSYDRSDGLSLPFGPQLEIDSGRVVLDATATYRSNLGAVDPRLLTTFVANRRTRLTLDAQRGTFTNELWIRGPIMNSLVTLFNGGDAHNYYRADRADLRLERTYESAVGTVTPFVAAVDERAWSVGPGLGAESGPFSFFGRHDRDEGMLRFNPPVTAGTIASGVVGATATFVTPTLTADGAAAVEAAGHAPDDRRFVQTTLDGHVAFPTFRDHSFEFYGHALLTAGDAAPPQRYSYLGGTNTLVTRVLLTMGGDQLLFVEGQYHIPISRIRLSALGSPVFTLRYAAGSAGIGDLPTLVQNIGARVSLRFLRYEYALDPVSHDSRSSFSLSITP